MARRAGQARIGIIDESHGNEYGEEEEADSEENTFSTHTFKKRRFGRPRLSSVADALARSPFKIFSARHGARQLIRALVVIYVAAFALLQYQKGSKKSRHLRSRTTRAK